MRTPIIDKNGKLTHVHRKDSPESLPAASVPSPALPDGEGVIPTPKLSRNRAEAILGRIYKVSGTKADTLLMLNSRNLVLVDKLLDLTSDNNGITDLFHFNMNQDESSNCLMVAIKMVEDGHVDIQRTRFGYRAVSSAVVGFGQRDSGKKRLVPAPLIRTEHELNKVTAVVSFSLNHVLTKTIVEDDSRVNKRGERINYTQLVSPDLEQLILEHPDNWANLSALVKERDLALRSKRDIDELRDYLETLDKSSAVSKGWL